MRALNDAAFVEQRREISAASDAGEEAIAGVDDLVVASRIVRGRQRVGGVGRQSAQVLVTQKRSLLLRISL